MSGSTFTVRTMSRADLERVIGWAAAEGWNPGRHDASAFHIADPAGFLVGIVDDHPVASISAVRYQRTYGFVGLYIVAPEHRGRGFGISLWRAGLRRLQGCLVGLDGVVAQQDNYRRSGFRLAHRNVRFGGDRPATADGSGLGTGMIDAREIPFDRLLALDGALFPAPRPAFLAQWIAQPDGAALVAIGSGDPTGFGAIRPCATGHKIGPLYADDPATADALFLALCARVETGPVFLDVPANNAAALALAERYGLKPMFETARMYNGRFPAIDLARLYGITTFELG